MGWLATLRVEILKLAVAVPAPLLLSVPCPMLAPPSEKTTTPVGLVGPLTVTVAVKATLCPHTAGLVPDTTAVVLLALLTVWVSAAELLTVKFVSPLYLAVTVWLPTANNVALLKEALVTPPMVLTLTGLPALLPS